MAWHRAGRLQGFRGRRHEPDDSARLKSSPGLDSCIDPGIFVFIAVIAVVGAVGYLVWRANKKRRAAFAALASKFGLTYEHRRRSLDPRFRKYSACSGNSPRVRNQISGTYRGRRVMAFDFEHTVQHGKERRTEYRGVTLTPIPPLWPAVSAVPENFGYKLADMFGVDEIDFESQEFSDKYWVRSKDRRFAYDLFHPRTMELMLAPGPLGASRLDRWQLSEGHLVLWHERRFTPAETHKALDRICDFMESVPDHLWPKAGNMREAET